MKIELERAQQEIRKLDVELATSRAVSYEAITRVVNGDIFLQARHHVDGFRKKRKRKQSWRMFAVVCEIRKWRIIRHKNSFRKFRKISDDSATGFQNS